MRRALVLAAAVVLSGCASIPSSGPVVQGVRVDALRNSGYVRVIARPPQEGMDPEALVRGFLAASASLTDGDDTARLYLTEEASADWRPGLRTEVYDAAALTVSPERDDIVRVTAPLIGTVDSNRRFQVAPAGSTMEAELHVRQQGGQWRIDIAPKALYLGEADLLRSLRVQTVYYLDAAGEQLVPEYVLLPAGSSNPVTLLARQLIAGPANRALRSAVPAGTRLQYATVVPGLGAASVGLDSGVRRLPPAERQAMLAQFTWTLSQLPDVNYVSIMVDGTTLTSALGSGSLSRGDFIAFDPGRTARAHALHYVRDDKVFGYYGGVPRLLRSGFDAASATVSEDGRLLAAVGANRRLLFVSYDGDTPRFVASGNDLSSPWIDDADAVWYLDREVRGGLYVWDAVQGSRRVVADLPPRARILDFAFAPDRTRIALIVNDGVTTTVRLGVLTGTSTEPRIDDLRQVEQRLTTALAIAWAEEARLVVLGSVGAVAVQPIGVALPLGTLTLYGGPANPVSLAAVPGAEMVVGDSAGQLWRYEGGRWNASELGTSPNYGR